MGLSFGNLAGLWALLGIPAILLIHFLQRQTHRVPTSTLFLLEQTAQESVAGRRFQRLRQSPPLWLQLLAVIILTWLLIEPRWLRADSLQRVVIVVDSSVSLSAFRAPLRQALATRLPQLTAAAAKTEWALLESDVRRGTLYTGTDGNALLAALDAWQPLLGTHDVQPALRVGQSLLQGGGLLLFVTDHIPAALPEGVTLLAVGAPTDNCGFIGVTVTSNSWTALVKNHGATTQTRPSWLEVGDQKFATEELVIGPGQTRALKGTFPPHADRCVLVLRGDALTVDDRLPLIAPQPKQLIVHADGDVPFFDKLLASIPQVTRGAPADVTLTTGEPRGPAIRLLHEPAAPTEIPPGALVAENHPLLEGLNWQGLIVRAAQTFPAMTGDDVLLWQGARPLVFLRAGQLFVNFDLAHSNAEKWPAFVVLLARYLETVRAQKVAFEARNVELNQLLALAVHAGGEDVSLDTTRVPPLQAPLLRAPAVPGFFVVNQGTTTLLHAAAHFADTREADLRTCGARDDLAGQTATLVTRNSRTDFLWPVWTLLLAGLLAGSWATGRRSG